MLPCYPGFSASACPLCHALGVISHHYFHDFRLSYCHTCDLNFCIIEAEEKWHLSFNVYIACGLYSKDIELTVHLIAKIQRDGFCSMQFTPASRALPYIWYIIKISSAQLTLSAPSSLPPLSKLFSAPDFFSSVYSRTWQSTWEIIVIRFHKALSFRNFGGSIIITATTFMGFWKHNWTIKNNENDWETS